MIYIFRHVDMLHFVNVSCSFQPVQDLIPFFMCMEGDFTSACNSLFPSLNASASRLTPPLFLFYLHVFETATAPKLMVSHPQQLCSSDATWRPIKGQTMVFCILESPFSSIKS